MPEVVEVWWPLQYCQRSKSIRPFLRPVDDGENDDLIVDDGIGHDVGRAGDHQLSGARYPSRSAKMWRPSDPPHRCVDRQHNSLCTFGIALFDVLARMTHVHARSG